MAGNYRLCLPSIRKGNGLGHLLRSAWLSERMENTFLYLPEAGKEGFFTRIDIEKALLGRKVLDSSLFSKEELPSSEKFIPPAVFLDRRNTTPEILFYLPENSTLVGIDEGGDFRDRMIYLADSLPGLSGISDANISSPCLLEGPVHKRKVPEKIEKVLVTFGGEDPGNLGLPVLGMLKKINRELSAGEKLRLTICLGPMALDSADEISGKHPGVDLLLAPSNLKELLSDYDLVITSFGLTSFEAYRAGVPVILINPSSYHEKLSLNSGFITMGTPGKSRQFTGTKFIRKFLAVIGYPERINSYIESGGNSYGLHELPEFLSSVMLANPGCPACGEQTAAGIESFPFRLLQRFQDRTWYECMKCSMVFQNPHRPPEEDYGEDYFFRDYKNQYGKTYLEDFPNLRRMAGERLDIIEGMTRGNDLLEIGCAYGPFLTEARGRKFNSLGIDVAQEAVDYVNKELGIPAKMISMEKFDLKRDFNLSAVDCIVLWYVIEHFPDLAPILEKISSIQKTGGVLAFSTPNYRGVSGRKDRRAFLKASPPDHFQIWSPSIARKVLKLYGYRVRKIRVTGHHPERFPLAGRKRGTVLQLFLVLSRLFGLGDTFEVYAEKI